MWKKEDSKFMQNFYPLL